MNKKNSTPEENLERMIEKLDIEFKFTGTIREVDRFDGPWNDVVLVAPPVNKDFIDWAIKAYESSRSGATVVLVGPSRTADEWFQEWVLGKADDIRFTKYNIPFSDYGEKGKVYMPGIVAVYKPDSGFALDMTTQVMGYRADVFMKVSVMDNSTGFGDMLFSHLQSIPKEKMRRMLSDFLTRK